MLRGKSALVGWLRHTDAILNALQDASDSDLDELIQVAGRDGEKLDALQQRIRGILGFFEDALVEVEPGLVAGEEQGFYWRRFRGRR